MGNKVCVFVVIVGSTIAQQKHDTDSDGLPESHQIQGCYWIQVTIPLETPCANTIPQNTLKF